MAGNVSEWTSGSLDPDFRGIRGGSWESDDPSFFHAAFRDSFRVVPGNMNGVQKRSDRLGFRCAR
jgi:formylglycine-generating enzyme required for sulfatase activity